MHDRPSSRRGVMSAVVATLLLVPMLLLTTATPAGAETFVLTGATDEPFRTTQYNYTDASCTTFASPDEQYPSPNQAFEAGPGTPPSGTGSLQMAPTADSQLQLYRTSSYDDTPLSAVTALSYSTYVETVGAQPATLRLHIDHDADGAWDEILMFIPANNDPDIVEDQWQTWDAFAGVWNVDSDTGTAGAVTLDAYLAQAGRDDATIVQSFDPTSVSADYDPDLAGGFSFVRGCASNQTNVANIDEIVVGTTGDGIEKYDLESATHARTLTVSPTAGRAGTQLTVSGTDCYEPTASAALVKVSGESGTVVDSVENIPVAANGTWSTTELSVPQGSDHNATYVVGASCGTDPAFSYANQPFDVAESMTAGNGYRMVAADGGIFTFGFRNFWGSTGNMTLNKPIVGGATDQSDYDGYWIVASDGGVFTFNAEFHGSLGGQVLTSPATEIEPTPTGKGYWIVLANGKVYAFGDAKHHGDMSTKGLNKPVIGMSVTPSGMGYWLVAEDGGIFSFGDAAFFGSMGGSKLNAPVIDLAPMPDGQGYYLVAKDGGVFTFGTALFKGSTGNMTLNQPVIAMLVAPNGTGYWLAASDGGIFTFGNVGFLGSMGHKPLNAPVLDLIN